MEIIVCVKQVADPEALVEVDADGRLDVENRWVTGFFDEVAIEQAVQLGAALGARVTAVTVGTGKATDALRRAIAMGAKRAIQVDDPAAAGLDGVGVARAIAAVLAGEPADLVLCGRASSDDEASSVAPALAQLLGLPLITEVVGLEIDGDGLAAQRAIEGGTATSSCALPAVLAVGKGLVEPRVPKVTGVMKAMRAPIDRRSLADLGLEPSALQPAWRLVRHHRPPRRPDVTMIAGEPAEQVRSLRTELEARGVLS